MATWRIQVCHACLSTSGIRSNALVAAVSSPQRTCNGTSTVRTADGPQCHGASGAC